ncbi:hypothetical protein KSP40_PGU018269 [Platanthera guangdongensis]|uniref:Uncharacterized protein n=1 Tax=Platanthera guangdongensis TaxID=2320717 RepID=A0ABR2LST8_9ASPA
MSSSVHYGGRDDFITDTSSTYNSEAQFSCKKNKEDDSGNSEVATRGDWWQGMLLIIIFILLITQTCTKVPLEWDSIEFRSCQLPQEGTGGKVPFTTEVFARTTTSTPNKGRRYASKMTACFVV